MRLTDILQGVQPSLGCTEPAAIALAAALAREAAGGEVKKVTVLCDVNVFKNTLHVNIPGLEEVKGASIAAGLGALAGDSQLRLEILSKVTPEDVLAARELVNRGLINVSIGERERPGLYIEALVETDQGSGRAIIEDTHTNVTAVEADGQPRPLPNWAGVGGKGGAQGGEAILKEMTLGAIVELAEEMTAEEMAYILKGVRMNEAAGREGLAKKAGLGIGASLAELVKEGLLADDLASQAEVLAAAAVDARMSGMTSGDVPSAATGTAPHRPISRTLSRLSMNSQRSSSPINTLFTEGWAAKSNVSDLVSIVLCAGNRAALSLLAAALRSRSRSSSSLSCNRKPRWSILSIAQRAATFSHSDSMVGILSAFK